MNILKKILETKLKTPVANSSTENSIREIDFRLIELVDDNLFP